MDKMQRVKKQVKRRRPHSTKELRELAIERSEESNEGDAPERESKLMKVKGKQPMRKLRKPNKRPM
jgi:hypothetical protein